MQKWLLDYYCKISLISLILQKTIIIQRSTLTQARLVIIPEMKLYVHKKSGYDSRDDVMFTQKLRL